LPRHPIDPAAGSRSVHKRHKLIAGEIGAATDRLGRKHDTIGEDPTMKLLYFDDFKLGVLNNDAGNPTDVPTRVSSCLGH
jgi:hypothetical protein